MYVSEWRDLTAADMASGYRNGEFSPGEMIDHALAVIERTNPLVNSMYMVDVEGARSAAAKSTKRWAAAAPLGPLDGVPTVIKDGLDASGWPNDRGSAADPERSTVAEHDAPAVARQREAGMILLGKSTMCDYGMLASGLSSRYGPARNPWDVSANTSGSSSGTAASIAAGVCPVAVGTDIVGSIRHPASFCGLAGLKPSQGRVPYMPPGAPSLCAGPMARSLDDMCRLLTLIARADTRDHTALPHESVDYHALVSIPLAGLRIGYLPDLGFGLPLDPQVEQEVEAAVGALASHGAVIRPIAAPFTPGEQHPVERFYQARYDTELDRLPAGERERSPVISPWAASAAERTATELFADIAAADRLRDRTMALMSDVDFLVLPTVPVPPYAAEAPGHDPDDFFLSWCNTFLFNMTGQPAMSMPCGLTAGGLPVGLQIVGPRFDDVGVIQLARRVDALLEPLGPWPRPEDAG